MADGLQIRTTKDYPTYIDVTLRIPKEAIIPVEKRNIKKKVRRTKKTVRKTKEFTEDDALKIAERGMREFYAGQLRAFESLDELLAQ